MRLLTTSEASQYLRLKERKLYELVAEGAIPCTKVTGKWLFPQHELDQWLMVSLTRPSGFVHPEPMPIVGGSHDPLLDWALRASASGLATLSEGSSAGLARFAEGGVVAAAIHLHGLDDGDANIAALANRADFVDAVLIGFVKREQGFLVPSGNPRGIATIADIVAGGVRMAMRPHGAGAHLLLLALLGRAGIAFDRLVTVSPACPTGPDIAQAIRAGRADCGVATRAVAASVGVDFVPIEWESFDLVMRQRDYFRPPLQALLGFLRGETFAARAAELGGYDIAPAGRLRFAR
jgi:putative molybdopterin biosynthesis protein